MEMSTEQTDVPTGARAEQGDAHPNQTDPKPSTDGSGRYAVYDTRFLRFVGPVTDRKPSKADARKLAGHDAVEVREV